MAKKSRYQDDDFTFEHVLARVEPWLRQHLDDREAPVVGMASRHLAAGGCPAQCRVCGVCHVVMHCYLAQQNEASYALGEYLTAARDQADRLREELAVAYARFRKRVLRARRLNLPPGDSTEDTVLAGQDEGEKAGRLLGAAVVQLDQAKQDILDRTITPNLADPGAARRPAYLRTVVELYLTRDGWKAVDVFQLLQGRAAKPSDIKRMSERARQARTRGDVSLLSLRQPARAAAQP